MISKKIIIGIVLLLILVISGFAIINKKNQYSVSVIISDQGWGYDILHGNKIIIHQPYMPGISGHVAFKNKNSARKTGELVVKKFRDKKSPAINIGELDSIIKDTN